MTGYPLDVPQPGAGLAAHCVMAYHLPLIIAFSLRPRTQFVWGGCMLLPLQLLRPDRLGILKVLLVLRRNLEQDDVQPLGLRPQVAGLP